MKKEIVVVAMSGGVDSSAAACLLLEAGYEVIGATMKLLEDDTADKAIRDAKEVCKSLGIKHYTFDLTKEFNEIVIQNFITAYQKGKTPNPCVVCNKFFKFGLFYEKAQQLGATKMATGHYAILENDQLVKSKVENKDQSYFLYGINKKVLPHLIFPLAKFHSKEDVREIARQYKLPISEKKESQEVCFVPNDDYKTFLQKQKNSSTSGDIRLKEGEIVGRHTGLTNYTIGQRKGLNIAYNQPLYVLKIDMVKNELIVGPNSSLFQTQLIATNINQLEPIPPQVFAKVRSRGTLQKANIKFLALDKILVTFEYPQRAITPGQSIVFYNQKNVCLGGAIIE